MTTQHQIADAMRIVALRLEQEIETGHRGSQLDANDLIDILTSVADELDAPVADPSPPRSVLDAARALLEARENQMVTRVEWDQLARAVANARE